MFFLKSEKKRKIRILEHWKRLQCIALPPELATDGASA